MDRLFTTRCLLIFSICSVFTEVSSAAVEISKSEGSISTNSKSRTGEQRHDALIYPTEVDQNAALNHGENFKIPLSTIDANPSPCPDDALFCESANDYPKDVIKRKLKKQPKLLLDILYEEEIDDDDFNKFGPESGAEKELCTSTAKTMYPNKAKSKEGVFEFVVNDDEYKQGIKVETCTTNGGECNELPVHILPLGYQSKCVQKYIQRILVVLNRNSTSDVQGFVTKPFEFPSCCSCVITMSVSGYNRFGGVDTTNITGTTPRHITDTATARTTNRSIREKQTTVD